MRKASDVWQAIEPQRIAAGIKHRKWRSSFEGAKAALSYINLVLQTTKEEFGKLEVPLSKSGHPRLDRRKVVVLKNNVVSKPIALDLLLTAQCNLLTDDERQEISNNVASRYSETRPKGTTSTNKAESCAVDELDDLLGITKCLQRVHLCEFRLADTAYSQIHRDLKDEAWLGDQIKHAVMDKEGVCNFTYQDSALKVENMLHYLNAGLSLTCIGKSAGKVDVVWFFHGPEDIQFLSGCRPDQRFVPRMHLKRPSPSEFTQQINKEAHRFDVGTNEAECERLLRRKVAAVETGIHHSLQFLNENDSMIPSEQHRLEHKAFAMIRAACAKVIVTVQRMHEDAYGPVDFRVDTAARIQDKLFAERSHMRMTGRLPYNPDDIDILQLTDIEKQQVYAIPFRITKGQKTESLFSENFLMHTVGRYSVAWKEEHKQHLYNLKTATGIQAYVKACLAAAKVPKLTDQTFYPEMIAANQHKFGSKKQMAERRAAA